MIPRPPPGRDFVWMIGFPGLWVPVKRDPESIEAHHRREMRLIVWLFIVPLSLGAFTTLALAVYTTFLDTR